VIAEYLRVLDGRSGYPGLLRYALTRVFSAELKRIDEFVFRFNQRNSHNRGLLFYRVLEEALTPESHVAVGAPRRPITKRRPAVMVEAAEAEKKQADVAECELLSWLEELGCAGDEGVSPDPFSPAVEPSAPAGKRLTK